MKKIRSDVLKIMAMVFMLIDHIGAGFIEPMFLRESSYEKAMRLYHFDQLLRAIGRLAFPIFCYQLVKGMSYTSSRVKYIRNLLLFSIISEPVFDLLFQNKIFDMEYQNVFFTLLLGALGIYVYEIVRDKVDEKLSDNISIYAKAVLFVAIYSVLALFAYAFDTDYDARGVILIAIIYLLRNNLTLLVTLTPILFMITTIVIKMLSGNSLEQTLSYCEFEVYSCLAFIFIYRDSGVRKGGKLLKWSGYAFYPVHILLIFLIRFMVLGE